MNQQQSALYEEITGDLTPFSAEIQRLIRDRMSGYEDASKSIEQGNAVFTQHCATCHQVGGAGVISGRSSMALATGGYWR